MLAKLAATGAAIATLLAAPLAFAQDKGEFGQQGDFIFGADRLFSLFAYDSETYGTAAGNVTVSGSSMSLLWGGNGVSGGAPTGNAFAAGVTSFYTAPRVGFDYVIIPHLTIGGELFAWFTLGGNTSTPAGNGTSVNTGNASGNEFGIAPRVGYIIGLNDMLSVWLRGGLSYYVANASSNPNGNGCNNNASLDVFGIDLDPQLVISPIPHFAFMAGPSLDWGFVGGWSVPDQGCRTTTSGNYNAVNFSINGGLIGWL
jgi:hypothetical protein